MLSLAVQNHRAGNLSAAEQMYVEILLADPHAADAHHLLGVVEYQTGRFDLAVASIGKALALNPKSAIYFCNLGLAQQAMNQLSSAVASFREAVRLQPDSADAHNALGNALRSQGKLEDATAHCRKALQLRPEFPEAQNNLANCLLEQDDIAEAIKHFQEALRLRPAFPEAAKNLASALGTLGNALAAQGKLNEAVDCYQETIRLNPSSADAYNNLGNVFDRQEKVEDAIRSFKQALYLQPGKAETHNNLATIRMKHGFLNEACAGFDQALHVNPDFAGARLNRSFLRLLRGDFDHGWSDFESRLTRLACDQPDFVQPRWDGSPLHGQTILLHAEQGLGDTLQFIRYASVLRKLGGKVVVRCQPELLRVLSPFSDQLELVADNAELPPFDLHAPLLSLPGILRTSSGTIPNAVPYLHADARLVKHWRKVSERQATGDDGCGRTRYSVRSANLKDSSTPHTAHRTPHLLVGIAWQGNPDYVNDRQRSIPLTHFKRLSQMPGVQLVSLQKGPGTDQLRIEVERPLETIESSVRDPQSAILTPALDESFGPFMDTAALMRSLDLVISSDSAIAHLAGALGLPVWVALPLVPDWRWLLERDDSPWYPTMRLFRQTRYGQWEDVFGCIEKELTKRVLWANVEA
jgi:tetratricopeptide (TPR) repeat protein